MRKRMFRIGDEVRISPLPGKDGPRGVVVGVTRWVDSPVSYWVTTQDWRSGGVHRHHLHRYEIVSAKAENQGEKT